MIGDEPSHRVVAPWLSLERRRQTNPGVLGNPVDRVQRDHEVAHHRRVQQSPLPGNVGLGQQPHLLRCHGPVILHDLVRPESKRSSHD